jgi:hypothetical protein
LRAHRHGSGSKYKPACKERKKEKNKETYKKKKEENKHDKLLNEVNL